MHVPLLANSVARALPTPQFAPVTIAVFPFSLEPPTHFGPRAQDLEHRIKSYCEMQHFNSDVASNAAPWFYSVRLTHTLIQPTHSQMTLDLVKHTYYQLSDQLLSMKSCTNAEVLMPVERGNLVPTQKRVHKIRIQYWFWCLLKIGTFIKLWGC